MTELSAAYLPEVHLSHSTEWALLGFATLIAAAGIIVLLATLLVMNLVAIILRNRYSTRW